MSLNKRQSLSVVGIPSGGGGAGARRTPTTESILEAICEHSMSECVYIAIFDLIVYRKSRLNLLRKL